MTMGSTNGENEPPIAVTAFELVGSFGAGHTTCWVLSSDTNADEETIGHQCLDHTVESTTTVSTR